MKITLSVCVLFLSAGAGLADQITMKDGDRITGDIVKKDGDNITVKSKNFGTVTLKWADVATVKSDEPLNVTLAGGKTVKANIETQGDRIQVAAPGAPQAVDPKDVVTLRDDAEEKTYQKFLHPAIAGSVDHHRQPQPGGHQGQRGYVDADDAYQLRARLEHHAHHGVFQLDQFIGDH